MGDLDYEQEMLDGLDPPEVGDVVPAALCRERQHVHVIIGHPRLDEFCTVEEPPEDEICRMPLFVFAGIQLFGPDAETSPELKLTVTGPANHHFRINCLLFRCVDYGAPMRRTSFL